MTAPDGSGIPDSRSTPQTAGPIWRPDQLLGARHDTPDQTGAVIDFESLAGAPEIAGQAAYEAECGCCEINDYYGEDYEPCRNCDHSPEEHEPPRAIAAAAPAGQAAPVVSLGWPADDAIGSYEIRCSCLAWSFTGTVSEITAAGRNHDDSPFGNHIVSIAHGGRRVDQPAEQPQAAPELAAKIIDYPPWEGEPWL